MSEKPPEPPIPLIPRVTVRGPKTSTEKAPKLPPRLGSRVYVKGPKTSTPETVPPTPETVPLEGAEEIGEINPPETHERISTCLNPENKGFFGRMSERAKNLADKVYEGLYKIPVVNKIIGRMEIAYNQSGIDNHETLADYFKNVTDVLDSKIGKLQQSKEKFELNIEELKSQNIPGAASLQLRIKILDQEIINSLNKKDIAQSQLEAYQKKAEIYTNERDRVANKFIEGYDKKLQPLQKTLENLQTDKDQADLDIAVMEEKHNKFKATAALNEKTKIDIENNCRGIGMKEKDIKKFEAVKQLELFLAGNRENMRLEKENLAKVKAEINKKIAKVDAKANPYRDKREKFVRIKGGRPIEMNVPIRKRGIEYTDTEEITSGTRAENSGRYESPPRAHERESSIDTVVETVEDSERLKTKDYISGWNAYLQEKYSPATNFLKGEIIDINDFVRSTRLSAEYKMDFKDFKNILTKYYKLKKIPANKLNENIDKFFVEKIKINR